MQLTFELFCILDSKLSKVYAIFPVPLQLVLITGLVLCILFTLCNMALHIYYNCNIPKIIATSVGLSMIIFFSCCTFMLTVGYFLLDIFYWNTNKAAKCKRQCMAAIWTTYPSLDFVLAMFLSYSPHLWPFWKNFSDYVSW